MMWINLVAGFLKAFPRIADGLDRLVDVGVARLAQERKEHKDEMVDDLIAAARERRMHKREAERVSGDSGEASVGDGADNGASGE